MLHAITSALKYCFALGCCAVVALCTLYVTRPTAQSNASPIYGVTIPAGYRDWKLIAVNQLKTDKVDQLRAQLGKMEASGRISDHKTTRSICDEVGDRLQQDLALEASPLPPYLERLVDELRKRERHLVDGVESWRAR